MKVNRDDFLHSLDEVRAAFGVSETELKTCVANGIIRYNDDVDVFTLLQHLTFSIDRGY